MITVVIAAIFVGALLSLRYKVFVLRAHPGSLDSWRGICSKSPEHDTDHGEAEECSNGRCVAFEVASQATVTTDPRVDQDVPLATLDLLARVVPRRIKPRPPF